MMVASQTESCPPASPVLLPDLIQGPGPHLLLEGLVHIPDIPTQPLEHCGYPLPAGPPLGLGGKGPQDAVPEVGLGLRPITLTMASGMRTWVASPPCPGCLQS